MFPLALQAMVLTFVFFALTLNFYWLVAFGLAGTCFITATFIDLTRF
jgi:hypothetical protein